jgi:hypothetical protein
MTQKLLTDGLGHLFIVIDERQPVVSRRSVVLEQTRTKRGWKLLLQFDSLSGLRVSKTVLIKKRLHPRTMNALGKRIAKAQDRARELRRLRHRPMATSLSQRAWRSIFSKPLLPEPAWLAHVERACNQNLTRAVLKGWIDQDKLDCVVEFKKAREALKYNPPGGLKAALCLFLFKNWQTISRPGMNSRKAHALAVAALGERVVGDISAFQRFLVRQGIKLAPAHAPRKK